ncbi:MAG: ATP-binding protein [Pseudomonadota bacterium]
MPNTPLPPPAVPAAAPAAAGTAPLAARRPALDPATAARVDEATGRKNMLQLIQLRWIAVVGQIATIEVVQHGLGIPLPMNQMLTVLACLCAFNVASMLRCRARSDVTNGELFLALLVDVGTLTVQLYLSGGATNPFVFLYLLQVILGAMLLEPWSIRILVAVTTMCFAELGLFSRPLAITPDHDRGLYSHYIQGMLVCFGLIACLLVVFISRINRNLRERDAKLAGLRQRAAEEEHIVRMGLLASGAAHELGTPLATLAVILGDWQHMPPFDTDPELRQEVAEMQAQVLRCKTIVSGILLSAGEARGESSARTTVRHFLDELVARWRAARPAAQLVYENRFGRELRDLPMVSDSALKQMVGNVLDNALEASPGGLRLEVTRADDRLVLVCTDAGPGFPAAMLAQFGKPYQSSKGRPGGGLGLFLVVNVARTLGGQVTALNPPGGGAAVTITLPLAAITLEEEEGAEDAD